MGEVTENELLARIACFGVGSRLGRTVYDIAVQALAIHEAVRRYPNEADRRHHVEVSRTILERQFGDLHDAELAAKKACGLDPEYPLGEHIDRLLALGPRADPEEMFHELTPLTEELFEQEKDAVRDAPIKFDPPLFRNLRRLAGGPAKKPEA